LTKFLYHTDVKELQMELILGVYEARQLFMFLFSLILIQLTSYTFSDNKRPKVTPFVSNFLPQIAVISVSCFHRTA